MNHAPAKLLVGGGGGASAVSNRPLCELWLRKSYSSWRPHVKIAHSHLPRNGLFGFAH